MNPREDPQCSNKIWRTKLPKPKILELQDARSLFPFYGMISSGLGWEGEVGESSNPRFHGEISIGEDEVRERKKKNVMLQTVWFSRLKTARGDPKAEIKTLVELSLKNESARAVYPFRPSGWFQRRGPKMQQKTSLTPERIFWVGLRLECFSRGFRTPN